jgi:colanic acid/amylovoran biosynthesis glycosyltransferase
VAREAGRPGEARGRLRVAFILRRFPRLSETFILNQITGLIDTGVDVEILALAPGNDAAVHPEVEKYGLMARTRYLKAVGSPLRHLGLACLHFWRSPPALLRAARAARRGDPRLSLSLLAGGARALQEGSFDVVHCQFGQLGLPALGFRTVGLLRGPIVVSFRGADLTSRHLAERYGAVFREAALVLCVSDLFRDRLIELGCDPAKIRVHRSGIDLRRFRYTEAAPPAGGPLRILTIARLAEKKGVEYAIQAAAILRYTGQELVYRIVGEGPLRPRLEALARELDVEDIVHFVGPRDHDGVLEALNWAHVLVAPSVTAASGDQEGIPNVLKEAMATGLPVVSTLHSGIPELVEDGVSGFLVPERDAQALAERLKHLADHPERWLEMGRAGRKRIEADYDSARLNQRLLDLYQQVACGPPPDTCLKGEE